MPKMLFITKNAALTLAIPKEHADMLTGKVVDIAIRGHFILDAALNAVLISKTKTFDVPLPHQNYERKKRS